MSTVSITIPCRNEEKYIGQCLQSIVETDFPKDKLHVFVCDGLSNDGTIEQINTFVNKYPFIHLINNQKQTTPYALNLGIKASTAEYRIILGAHSTIEPNFINENIKAFEELNDNNLACVGGKVNNIFENKESEIISYATSSSFGVGNAHYRTSNKSGFVDTVLFGAYKSDIFEKIGYFDEMLTRNQDDEFNYRILKNGFKIYLSNNIQSNYFVRSSFKKLFKQYYQYGYWKVIVNIKHRKITTLRQIVPLLFVLFLISGLITAWINSFFAISYLLGLAIYLLISAIEAFKTKLSLKNKFNLIKTFFLLHFSYGLGYLLALKDLLFFNTFATEKNNKITR